MANVQIVIKLDEDTYKDIITHNRENREGAKSAYYFEWLIQNGTPLPKGHGRLIDADALKKEYPHDTDWDYPVNTNCSVVESIDNAETIIEADKGYEAKVITHGNCMMCGKELDEGLFFCKECEEKDRKARGKEWQNISR